MAKLSQILDSYGISDEYLRMKITSLADPITVRKHTTFDISGSVSLYVLEDGIIRAYTCEEDGTEITTNFVYRRGQPFYSNASMLSPRMAGVRVYNETLTESHLYHFKINKIINLIQMYTAILKLTRSLINDWFAIQWEHTHILYAYSAKERYEWFLESYPDLLSKISHKYIASFLNMTPVTMSHVRRTINEENSDSDQEEETAENE